MVITSSQISCLSTNSYLTKKWLTLTDKIIELSPASYLSPIKKTIRETLFSRVCVFAFCLNSLHHLVMLGPVQPYQKSIAYRRLGSSWQIKGSWGEPLRSSVRVSYSRTDLRDPRFFASFNFSRGSGWIAFQTRLVCVESHSPHEGLTSSILVNWLPTPGINLCSCEFLVISQGLVQEINIKSTYLPTTAT